MSVQSVVDERLGPGLFITFEPESEQEPVRYGQSGQMRLDIGRTGSWGTIRFDGLLPELGEGSGPFDREPISGSVSWDCGDGPD